MTSSSDGLTAPFALVRFRADDGTEPRLGLVAGERVREVGPDDLGAPDLNAFLAEAPASWDRLAAVAERDDDGWHPLADVTLTAPVTPRQVLQTGANYRTHVIDLVAAGRAVCRVWAWSPTTASVPFRTKISVRHPSIASSPTLRGTAWLLWRNRTGSGCHWPTSP